MAVLNDPNTAANIVAVGEKSAGSTGAAAVSIRPIPTSIGAYRFGIWLTMATSQAANSRLFELRNSSSNLIIPTRVRGTAFTSGTVTTGYTFEMGLYRLTGFTALDTTNTVTPTSSVLRTSFTAFPGSGAQVRHVTVAGAAAGMTGGTMTKDAQLISSFRYLTGTAAPTAPFYANDHMHDFLDQSPGFTQPLVLAQNEGIEIENITAGSATSNVVSVYLEVGWYEVAAF